MNKKCKNNINFILILATCLIIGLISSANRVGGLAVLFDNLSPYNIGAIAGGTFGALLASIILAIIFNFILNVIRKIRGKEKRVYTYLQVWFFLLINLVLHLA